MLATLFKWLGFGVLISVLPFGLKAIFYWLDHSNWIGWYNLWPNGELMLVAVALGAESIGDLIDTDMRKHRRKGILTGVGCFLAAGASMATFGYIAAGSGQQPEKNIFLITVVLTIGALVAGGFCKAVVHIVDNDNEGSS